LAREKATLFRSFDAACPEWDFSEKYVPQPCPIQKKMAILLLQYLKIHGRIP